MRVTVNGEVSWLVGNLGDIPVVTLDYRTYSAVGWTIEARSPAPVNSLVLEACRHSPHIDQPQATMDAIVMFCAKIAEGAPSDQ